MSLQLSRILYMCLLAVLAGGVWSSPALAGKDGAKLSINPYPFKNETSSLKNEAKQKFDEALPIDAPQIAPAPTAESVRWSPPLGVSERPSGEGRVRMSETIAQTYDSEPLDVHPYEIASPRNRVVSTVGIEEDVRVEARPISNEVTAEPDIIIEDDPIGIPVARSEATEIPALPPVAVLSSWDTFRGADLREVLEAWSHAENVDLIWNLSETYRVPQTVVIRDSYENAVGALLAQYDNLYGRPVGSLHVSSDSASKTLVVFKYEGS